MPTENKRNEMIKRERIILNRWDAFAHYSLVFALGILNFLLIILGWNQKPPNPTPATMTNKDILIWTIVSMILITIVYSIQKKRLKLKKETIELEAEQILEVIKQFGQKSGWLFSILTKDYVQADLIKIFGTCKRITILIHNNQLFVNCRTTNGDIPGMLKEKKIVKTIFGELRKKIDELNSINTNSLSGYT